MAQRIASRQQTAVTPTTGRLNRSASQYCPSINTRRSSIRPLSGMSAEPRSISAAGSIGSIISGSEIIRSGIR
jgi:hypothetical protein